MQEFAARTRFLACLLAGAAGVAAAASPCEAQRPRGLDLGGAMEVGGEAERYLRMLSLTDTAGRPLSWSIGPFIGARTPVIAPADSHPWRARFPTDTASRFSWLRPTLRTVLNSALPLQDGPGPAWTGKGGTLVAQAGAAAHWGRLRVQLAPVAFIAQNASFALADNGRAGKLAYGDARFPTLIDYPQRFGDGSYGRVDLGASTVDLDLAPVALGVSTAAMRWGPQMQYPLVLGPNAGGFPHYYLGTSGPADLHVLRLNARLIGGMLPQSPYSSAPYYSTRRFASGAIVSLMPRGLDGLELGFDRFFESTQPFSVRRALLPISPGKFAGTSGGEQENEPGENQTASAFFRWAVPRGGVEVYGEWYREDYSGSVRNFLLVPDDLSSFALGVQRAWSTTGGDRKLFRFEIVNGELSPQSRLGRAFDVPLPPYLHLEAVQGHTLRGMLLGSPEAYGGEGWRMALDSWTPAGRRTIGVERTLRLDWLPVMDPSDVPVHPEVMYSLRGELLRFAGSRDIGVTLLPSVVLNRNLHPGNDLFNLHASVTIHGW